MMMLFHQTSAAAARLISRDGFDIDVVRSRGNDALLPDGVFLKTSAKPLALGREKTVQMPVQARLKRPLRVSDRDGLSLWLHTNAPEAARIQAEAEREIDSLDARANSVRARMSDFSEARPDAAEYDALKAELLAINPRILQAAARGRTAVRDAIEHAGHDALHVLNDVAFDCECVETIVVLRADQVTMGPHRER